jgi:hypothetical protein
VEGATNSLADWFNMFKHKAGSGEKPPMINFQSVDDEIKIELRLEKSMISRKCRIGLSN